MNKYVIDCMVNKETFLKSFIEYLEATDPDSWCTNVIRTKNGKNCLYGHLVAFIGDEHCSDAFDLFESLYATTYMIYPVNDGTSSEYIQLTPKDRCIAYLNDMLIGKQLTTHEMFEEYDKARVQL